MEVPYTFGAYDPFDSYANTFQWKPGTTPFSDLQFIAGTWVVYWTTILVLKWWMRDRPAFSLTGAVCVHNLILMVWSAVMCAWVVTDMLNMIDLNTWDVRRIFCLTEVEAENSKDVSLNRYWFHLYVYYLSKFYELLDTVILVLKKRPVIFLHWYHHSIVIAMVWLWLECKPSYSSIGMFANTLVHVFMYYYYMCAALKWSVWFKRHITSMQIVQFFSSFVLWLPTLRYHTQAPCAGMSAHMFSALCNASFLYLFVRFRENAYKKKE
eukprot:comp21477_c0_seq1/m.29734 comp21477_c0_seq1/g.29734  ORF comp21477_c0_seq1/g.29734 comp21477_c0_seq1/m.29734 type:complete len:267 (-) comp21477_c0_seq1:687-1487(-)